ncbi:MAG: Arm DNA-binding domain-containing protein [Coprobacillus cateniformis]
MQEYTWHIKRHIKSGFKTFNEAKKYERDFKEQLEVLIEQEKVRIKHLMIFIMSIWK